MVAEMPNCGNLVGADWVNQSRRGGMDKVSEGWKGCFEGFPKGKAQGKSRNCELGVKLGEKIPYWAS